MIARVSSLTLVALSGALLTMGLPMDEAAAQSQTCKTEAVSASGQAKFRPFTKTKELEGRGSGMADAVAKWEQKVSARFGEQWKKWSNASNTTFECAPAKSGKIIGSSFIACTISGRPCSTGGAGRSDSVVEREGDKRQAGSIGPRRSGDGARARDKYAHIRDGAYVREMIRQDYLQRQRDRAEKRAWQREDAKQRHLAMLRTRAQQGYGASARRVRETF
jgi:hypothetical protein